MITFLTLRSYLLNADKQKSSTIGIYEKLLNVTCLTDCHRTEIGLKATFFLEGGGEVKAFSSTVTPCHSDPPV